MFQDQKILIYGTGRVGNALKAFCDYNNITAEVKDDTDNFTDFSHYTTIIPSPGIAPSHRIYATGKIVGELDFIYGYLPKGFKIISVTGTDGKSTTAWILYNLLKMEYGEKKVFLSGNFEIPFAETVQTIQEQGLKHGYIVLEVSSFMAYNITSFQSTHSIFTNFEIDHLNWHPDLQDYFDAKIRLFEHTTGTSCINAQVFSRAQEFGLSISEKIPNIRIFGALTTIPSPEEKGDTKNVIASKAKQSRTNISFPITEDSETSSEGRLNDCTDGENIIIAGRKKYKLNETQFSGIHNAMNILSSTLITSTLGICSKRTREYLKNISGLAHRLELVTIKNDITFIDDSKSTSAQSLIAALGSFDLPQSSRLQERENEKKIILIAGGSDKGDTFEHLGSILERKVKHAELIGATREILGKICEQYAVSYHYSESMDEAVEFSLRHAEAGDTVLLSPGCASFGMFQNYLDRANKFREAVGKI